MVEKAHARETSAGSGVMLCWGTWSTWCEGNAGERQPGITCSWMRRRKSSSRNKSKREQWTQQTLAKSFILAGVRTLHKTLSMISKKDSVPFKVHLYMHEFLIIQNKLF